MHQETLRLLSRLVTIAGLLAIVVLLYLIIDL